VKTYHNISEYDAQKGAVVTIGTFDGVHQGHQKILLKVAQIAREKQLTSILLTFFPHPRMVLQPESDMKLINTIEERRSLVFENHIEHIVTHPFSTDFARTSAHDYVKKILVDQLGARVVVIGYDHRFGRNRAASINELRAYGEQYDFEVVEISKKEIEEVAVSSTKVRNALLNGDISTANSYLNRDFSIKGMVIHGKQLGRTIGFPTANLSLRECYKLVPKNGVYITYAIIGGHKYYGMTNIGVNPTVNQGTKQHIETYFIDFKGDLYDQELELFFLSRIRDEKAFKSIEDLKKAVLKDEQTTREYAKQLAQ
jgi:riboflavin kinase/FMN adenylyltransferase